MARHPEGLLDEAQRLTDQASQLWNEGAFPETESLCRQALKLTRTAVGDRDPRVAERLYNLATLYYFQRRFEEAKPLYLEAILIHEAQPAADLPALAFCYAWLGKALFEGWREDPGVDARDEGRSFKETESCYRQALKLLEEADAADTPEYAGCLMHLAFLHFYLDRLSLAEPLYRQALALRENIFGPDHIETGECVGRLAILYWQDENGTEDPEPLLRRALELHEKQLDAGHPDLWEWIYRLAEFCRACERDAEARQLFIRLAALIVAADPPDEDVNWIVTGCLDYLNETGQTALIEAIEARGYLENPNIRLKRVEIKRRESMFGPQDPRVADVLRSLADDLRFEEQYEEAEALYDRVLSILENSYGFASPTLLCVLNGAAMLLRAQDRIEPARAVLDRAVNIPVVMDVPEEVTEHACALEQLAWVLAAQDEGEQAEILYRHAIDLIEGRRVRDKRLIAEMRFRLSIFCAQDGRLAEAEENILTALQTADAAGRLDQLEIADYREHYAEVLTRLGRRKEARIQLEEVRKIWDCASAQDYRNAPS